MNNLRAIFKLTAVVVFTLLIYGYYFVGYLLLKLKSAYTEPWRNKILRRWGRVCARILSVKISVTGQPPEPPFLLVCNHLSYLDIIVCYATVDTTIVSKSEVAGWPVLGVIARTIGVVFIDRSRKMDITRVNKEITDKINERQGITIYPEGTTSSGETVLRFKPSLLQPAADNELPVYAAAIKYSLNEPDSDIRTDVYWWGDVPLYPHLLNFAKLRSVEAEIVFSSKIFVNTDRKELAKSLHQEVIKMYSGTSSDNNTAMAQRSSSYETN